MKLYEKDLALVRDYLVQNGNKTLLEVYNEIKSKNVRNRTKAEMIIFTYLYMNRKKLCLK